MDKKTLSEKLFYMQQDPLGCAKYLLSIFENSSGENGDVPIPPPSVVLYPVYGEFTSTLGNVEGLVVDAYAEEDESFSNSLSSATIEEDGSYELHLPEGSFVLKIDETDTFSGYVSDTFTVYGIGHPPTTLPSIDLSEKFQPTYKVYGVRIDCTNPDPETAVTYIDDAVGMTPGSTDWDLTDIFKDIRPVEMTRETNPQIVSEINKNNFGKRLDGNNVGGTNNVMIEFPKMGYKINYVDANTLEVKVTRNPDAKGDGFCYYAHTRETEGDRDYLYIGAYLGWVNPAAQKVFSLSSNIEGSDRLPTTNLTLSQFRNYVHNLGEGYDLLSFYPLTLLQCLYLIRYKNLNSQSALGQGYTASANNSIHKTGGTDTKGMYYGEQTGTEQMKFCGIEDFYGNAIYWIDGLYCDNNYNIKTAFKNFNDDGTGYPKSVPSGITSNISGYLSKVQGSNDTGFIGKETSGTDSTFFADISILYAARLPSFGGSWANSASAGAFYLRVYYTASISSAGLGARLMYL